METLWADAFAWHRSLVFRIHRQGSGARLVPNIAAFMVTVWVEYRQWLRSKKPFMVLLKERWLDSLVDILAGNAGFILGYNVLLRLFAGGWIV